MQSAQNKALNQDDGSLDFIYEKRLVFPRHFTRGRARFFVRGLFDSDFLKSCLERELSAKKEIFFCSANTHTGNILIRFRDDVDVSSLRDTIEDVVHNMIVVVLHDPAIQKKIKRETIHPHVLSADDTCHMLASSAQTGLSEKEAARRLRLRGPNVLRSAAQPSSLTLFMEQFNNLPSTLLGGAALLSVLTGGTVDAVLIGAVLLANGFIAFQTQKHANDIISSIDRPSDENVLVIRDGTQHSISPADLVEGDVVLVRIGPVPADMRLLSSRRLSVDESSLTGESVPVVKNADARMTKDSVLSERNNMLFRGTTVTGGEGIAIVTATGSDTELGRVQRLVNEAATPDTPLQKDLQHIGDQAVTFTGLLCCSVFVVGILRGIPFKEMLKTVISLSIAAIPEGLPTIDTTALAHSIKKLEKNNILIKNLNAIETLGAVDIVCLDKTGTLTCNEMTLEEIYVDHKSFVLKDGRIEHWEQARITHPELEQLLLMTVLCCEATTTTTGDIVDIKGSGTETAFVKAAIEHGIDVKEALRDYARYKTEWRTEQEPYMKTYHTRPHEKQKLLAVKGSPMAVLQHCTRFLSGDKVHPIHPSFRTAVMHENEKMAAKGLRVLAVAFKNFEHDALHGEWIWVGSAGLMDPLRPHLKPLIEALKSCGIHVCVLTGDQASTALAIGRELNLNGSDSMQVLDSQDIAQLTDDELQEKIKEAHIFSRVNPSQKLRIVNAFQKSGKIVAMTGDGINDGPALKIADVGITMGHVGANNAREIADIVVADDRLESLIAAIKQGRTLRKNLHHSVSFILSTNISESLVTLGALLIGESAPFNPKQLLWINLVTDIFPGLALALESPRSDDDFKDRAIGNSLITEQDRKTILREAIVLTLGTLAAYKMPGGSTNSDDAEEASTVASLAMVSGQMLHSWQSRHHHAVGHPIENGMLIGATLGGVAAQMLTVAWPVMRDVLDHRPLRKQNILPVLVGSVAPYMINRYLDSRQRDRSSQSLG